MKRVGSRRSDKKRDIKPTVSIFLKDVIYRLANLTYLPVKDVAQRLTISVLNDRKVIEHLSQYFKRDYLFQNTVFCGFIENADIIKRKNEPSSRITIRFTQREHEALVRLSFALDCSVSRTVALLLQIATQNIRFINAFIKQYLQAEITERQMRELREIIKYVGETGESHHSWASLLALVFEEIGNPLLNIKEAIEEFLNRNWRQ